MLGLIFQKSCDKILSVRFLIDLQNVKIHQSGVNYIVVSGVVGEKVENILEKLRFSATITK